MTHNGVSRNLLQKNCILGFKMNNRDSLCPLGGSGGASSTLDSDQEFLNCGASGGLPVLTAADGVKENGLLWER